MQPSWPAYYKKVIQYPHRAIVERAVALIDAQVYRAIDIGCGVGRDTQFLLEQGIKVYAFDIEEKAIEICQRRFGGITQLNVSVASFATYRYPKVSLVVANSSLFFCPEHQFKVVWEKIVASLEEGGVFCGDFLGVMDTWVSSPHHCVSAFTQEQVMALFGDFEMVTFTERNEPGNTAVGVSKHWHTFTVLAVKRTTHNTP